MERKINRTDYTSGLNTFRVQLKASFLYREQQPDLWILLLIVISLINLT